MPIPSPNSSEKSNKESGKQKFISRCISDPQMRKEYQGKQLAGICYSQWESAKKQKTSEGSIEEPTWDEIKDKNYIIIN